MPHYQDKDRKKPAAIENKNENKNDNIKSETDKMDEREINRQLLATPEQLNAEIWMANAREALNAGQTVYLVTDEADMLTIQQHAFPAIYIKGEYIPLLLDVIRKGVIADRLFIPKAGRDGRPDSYKVSIETGLKETNAALSVYVCSMPDGMNSLSEFAKKEPGTLSAWIANNEAVIEEEREQYDQKTTGAGRLDGLLEYIEESKQRPVISTGFPTLDLELGDGGIVPGGLTAGLYTIGAISSLGKTTFAMQIADNIAAGGKDVLVIALEMAAFELMAKSISRLTTETATREEDYKTVQGIMQGTRWTRYSEAERQAIEEATAKYSQLAKHLYIVEGIGNIGADDVRRAIKRHIEMKGEAPVVIVDYLQILAPADPHATDKANTDKAVLEMKRISRDYKTPVICISSFNRQNYRERVSMEALKESGAIEYSSDVVIGLQLKGAGGKDNNGKPFDVDEAKQKNPREIEAVILKNRSGKTGATVQFEYEPRFNLFRDVMNGHRYSAADLPSGLSGRRNR